MNDLASLTAQPRPFVVNGRTYLVYPLTIGEFGKLQAWVDDQYRNPVEVAMENMDGLSVARQKFLLESALSLASKPKPKLGTEEADNLIRSMDGLQEILYLGISKGDPTFRRADAEALFQDMTPEQLAAATTHTEVDQVLSDPKSGETA